MLAQHSFQHPFIVSSSICAVAAALEALCAGRGIKRRFAELRLPRFSPGLGAWIVIGLAYYVICFTVAYRLLVSPSNEWRTVALVLLLKVLFANAIWNYLFFRVRSIGWSFALGVPYSAAGIALLALLTQVDAIAAWTFAPYAAYLIYANIWGYALLQANRGEAPGHR